METLTQRQRKKRRGIEKHSWTKRNGIGRGSSVKKGCVGEESEGG